MAGQWHVAASLRDRAWRAGSPGGVLGKAIHEVATLPALLPVKVVPTVLPTPEVISLRNERGWTLTLPNDVPASWLAELMRAL